MAKKKPVSLIDVLSHDLVPEMKILSDSEKKKVLKEFSIEENQLPKMLATDPAVQALKADVGDVIAIYREDLTSKYTAYKLIIAGSGK